MNRFKRLIALFLCLIMLFSLCACDESDKAYIYFNLNEQPVSLDPQTAQNDTELLIIRNIFEGLMRKNEEGKIVCGAAETYKKNGLVYTFNLRKGAMWSNEESLTAYDFLFALQRAVDPKTKAPFAKRLINIKNADAILKGKKSVEDLAVKVIDAYTLKIELSKEDPTFLETLTTSIAMPCNEDFFKNCAGKYGLEGQSILSNGSYRLTKWGKTVFGIRLYRNKFYNGNFTAKNAAVFLSIDKERTSLQTLKENDADIAFISPLELGAAAENGLKTAHSNNICWFLTISDGFSKNIRTALINLASPHTFEKSLINGYSPAQSIFPNVLSANAGSQGLPVYDLEASKKLFFDEIKSLKDKKFPEGVVLYYYDDGFSKTVVTDIVAHWQSQLGAYINIEAVSSPEKLTSQLKDQTYALSIFPVFASSQSSKEYLEKFGINYKGGKLSKIQKDILKSKNIVPLMTQDTVVAYNKNLTSFNFSSGNGLIDFAYVVKTE